MAVQSAASQYPPLHSGDRTKKQETLRSIWDPRTKRTWHDNYQFENLAGGERVQRAGDFHCPSAHFGSQRLRSETSKRQETSEAGILPRFQLQTMLFAWTCP